MTFIDFFILVFDNLKGDIMKKTILLAVMLTLNIFANEMIGENLIPINKTDVQLQKMRLNLTRKVNSEYIKVKSDYILVNPSKEQNLIVGFEAGEIKDKNLRISPFLYSITISVNGKDIQDIGNTPLIPHKFADGIKDEKLRAMVLNSDNFDEDIEGMRYLYLFNLKLKNGKNHIKFEYFYKKPKDFITHYRFEHKLSNLSFWAKHSIDLFELNLDVDDFQQIRLEKGFYQSKSELKYNGVVIDNPKYSYVTAYLNDGLIKFRKKDFHSSKNFKVFAFDDRFEIYGTPRKFDYKKDKLNFMIENTITRYKDNKSRMILQVLPYARRGYVFKKYKWIQKYYEQLEWYQKNPDLNMSNIKLFPVEKILLKK